MLSIPFSLPANSKKSSVGYTPFIAQLAAAGYVKEALRYVPKVLPDKTDKAKLTCVWRFARLSQSVSPILLTSER